EPLLQNAGFHEGFRRDRSAGVEQFFEIAHVDFGDDQCAGVGEPALRYAADQRRAAALENGQPLPAGTGELPLVTAASRLTLATAKAAAFAVGTLMLMNALVDFV